MSRRAADQLASNRALRDNAWAVVKDDVALMRADLDDRSIGGRIADRLGASARTMGKQAMSAAGSHRGMLGASLVALALWLGRKPILAGIRGFLDRDEGESDLPDGDDNQE